MAAFDDRLVVTVLRWIGRIMGAAVLMLVAAIAIGEGVPNPFTQPAGVNLLLAAMLAMLTGLAVAWRWEGAGGLLILGGWVFFAVVNHGIPFNVVFGPVLLAGLLFLICWWRTRKTLRA